MSREGMSHIADNGLSIDEVEDVLYDPSSRPIQSRSSQRPAVIGRDIHRQDNHRHL